jgi:hypothetical protein
MTVALGKSKDGSWKVSDLPLPVGITPRASLPERTASITSSCPGRKWRMLKRSAASRKLARSIAGCEDKVDLWALGMGKGSTLTCTQPAGRLLLSPIS